MRIGGPTRRHGVPEEDVARRAHRDRKIDMDEGLTMLIGPARDGMPLEIGVLGPGGDDPVIIHAMRLRPKFYPFISQG